jgi:NADP-dependent 3-hydroxy acid dehydrogenase YdfG
LITGGASGIGAALAIHYAGPGVSVALTDIDDAGLQRTSAACAAKGASVSTSVVDVTNAAAMASWVARIDKSTPVDAVFACAGKRGGDVSG